MVPGDLVEYALEYVECGLERPVYLVMRAHPLGGSPTEGQIRLQGPLNVLLTHVQTLGKEPATMPKLVQRP